MQLDSLKANSTLETFSDAKLNCLGLRQWTWL